MMYARPFWILCLLIGLLAGGENALAQAAHDTSLLSDAERTHYRNLLSKSNDSAQRAKVKSEMNRLIQTRQIERRQDRTDMSNTPEPNAQKGAHQR